MKSGRACWLIDAIALALALALFAAFAPGIVDPAPYNYDESDYMLAANAGFWANYIDSGTMSVSEFLRLGWEAARGRLSGANLSTYVRERNDILFYRHYHGPVYYNALRATAAFHGEDERGTRGAGLLLQALICLTLYAGVRWLIPGVEGRVAATIFFFVYLFSPTAAQAATVIAPHIVFVFVAVAATILAAKWIQTAKIGYWYGAIAASAAATCTLEVGLGLIPALGVCCWFERRRLFKGWTLRQSLGFAARSLAVWTAALLVVWPAALLKLSLMKGCFFMAYLAAGRAAAFGGTAFLEGWRLRLLASPAEWLTVVAGFLAFAVIRRRGALPGEARPMLAFALLMLASMLRVSTNMAKYTIVYLAPLELFASIMLAYAAARLRPSFRNVLAGLICAGAIGAAAWRLPALQPAAEPSGPISWKLIDFARQERVEYSRFLAPQDVLPTLHFYFPKAIIRGYRDAAEMQSLAECRCYDGVLTTTPALRYTAFVPKAEPAQSPQSEPH